MKRVLVVQGEHLLTDGIASLLVGQSDLHVSHTSSASIAILNQQIEEFRPSILILEMSHGLEELASLAKLLKSCPEIRVIMVDDKKNLIHIYDKQEMAVARSADLIAAIRQ